MAPDAPPPTFNGHGNQVREFLVVLRYDATRDVLTCSWTQDGDAFRRTQQGAFARPPGEVTQFLEEVARQFTLLNSPRLF